MLEARLSEQRTVLDEGAALVKPGGRLAYITCSVLPSENRDQVDAFLARHPEFKLIPWPELWERRLPGCAGSAFRRRLGRDAADDAARATAPTASSSRSCSAGLGPICQQCCRHAPALDAAAIPIQPRRRFVSTDAQSPLAYSVWRRSLDLRRQGEVIIEILLLDAAAVRRDQRCASSSPSVTCSGARRSSR